MFDMLFFKAFESKKKIEFYLYFSYRLKEQPYLKQKNQQKHGFMLLYLLLQIVVEKLKVSLLLKIKLHPRRLLLLLVELLLKVLLLHHSLIYLLLLLLLLLQKN
jgi:hypothetical protein